MITWFNMKDNRLLGSILVCLNCKKRENDAEVLSTLILLISVQSFCIICIYFPGTARSGLLAHQVSDHPHRHQAREYSDECWWALCPEACSWSHWVAEGWSPSPLWLSKYETQTQTHTHVYLYIHEHSLYSFSILFSVSTAPAPKQVQHSSFSA